MLLLRETIRPLCDNDRRVLRRVLNTSGQFIESIDDVAEALRLPRRTVENSLRRLRTRGIVVREARRDSAGHRLPAGLTVAVPPRVEEMLGGQLLTDLKRRAEKPTTTSIDMCTAISAPGGDGLVAGNPTTTPTDVCTVDNYRSTDKPQSNKHIDQSTVTVDISPTTTVGMVVGKNCQSQLAQLKQKLSQMRHMAVTDSEGRALWEMTASAIERQIATLERETKGERNE